MKKRIEDLKLKIYLIGSLALIFLLFLNIGKIHALYISPARQTVIVEPGTAQTIPLNVYNDENEIITLIPEVSPFVIDSKTGAPIFDVEDEAKNWLSVLPRRLRLEPGQRAVFTFNASIPENTQVKSHYLGLFARQKSEGGQVGVGSRVGSLLFLHIAGELEEEVMLEDFASPKKIYFKGPAEIILKLKNSGSIHVVLQGKIEIQNMFGMKKEPIVLNESGYKILPGGEWERDLIVENLSWKDIGKIKLHANIKYGLAEKELHTSSSFWYLPVWFVISAVLALFLLFVLFWHIHKKVNKS